MESNCKFYELDLEAQKEAESMDAFLPEWFKAEEADYSAHMEAQAEENDPFSNCGPFCKFLKSGKGYPGEYVYYCCAEGNEHIINVDFNESEII